ncbi:MAG: hypothetical protein V4622_09915 [Bacteroidota bacterium]
MVQVGILLTKDERDLLYNVISYNFLGDDSVELLKEKIKDIIVSLMLKIAEYPDSWGSLHDKVGWRREEYSNLWHASFRENEVDFILENLSPNMELNFMVKELNSKEDVMRLYQTFGDLKPKLEEEKKKIAEYQRKKS